MKIYKGIFFQIVIIFILVSLFVFFINNLIINLIRTDLGFNFSWLFKPASFALAEHALPYSPSDSYAWALFIGWLNSLKVIFISLFLSTIVGIIIGLSRTGNNVLLKIISSFYITIIRQTPLLLQLMFWYFVGFLGLKNNFIYFTDLFKINNQGIEFFSLSLTSEFSALIIGLSVFTSAFIGEVIRGGIDSVPNGQWESFRSLGLSERNGLLKVIIPQALPAIIPGLTSQYLNLAKNSTLAIAIGYSDIYAINDTIINQTGRAIECFIILLLTFLILNLLITNLMETINKFINKKKIYIN